MKKKSFIMKNEKKNLCRKFKMGYCPDSNMKKKKYICIVMQGSVLQEVSGLREFCVAIQ